jgi:hypothetical protein
LTLLTEVVPMVGDQLALRVLTRIGTTADGTHCGGHRNAVGVRLYYDAVSRPARVEVGLASEPLRDLFLHTNGGDVLEASAPTATTPQFKDAASLTFAGGNPWRTIGTWSRTLP